MALKGKNMAGETQIMSPVHPALAAAWKDTFFDRTVNDPLTIICPHHGIIEISPKDHYRVGCFQCKKSRLEDLWLDSMGIPNDGTSRQVPITVGDRKMIVDGYDGNNTVFLFHGDFWHGNPEVYDLDDINPRNQKRFGDLYNETLEYEQTLRDAGYTVVVEWEKEWYDKNDDTQTRKRKRKR